jgi:hypothetical protein
MHLRQEPSFVEALTLGGVMGIAGLDCRGPKRAPSEHRQVEPFVNLGGVGNVQSDSFEIGRPRDEELRDRERHPSLKAKW